MSVNKTALTLGVMLAANVMHAQPPPAKLVDLFARVLADRAVQANAPKEDRAVQANAPKEILIRKSVSPPQATVNTQPFPGTRSEEVILRNTSRDRFSGKLIEYDPTKGLIWKHPSIRDPLIIKLADISSISLKHEKPSVKAREHKGRINLLAGCSLTGDLVTLGEKELVLDTWYAGQLKLPRALLTGLYPDTIGARVLYEGPSKDDGWMTGDRNAAINNRLLKFGQPAPANRPPSSGRWLFDNNAFQSTGSNGLLARKIKYPDRINLEFDLNWTGSPSFNIGIHFFGNRFDQYQSNAYAIRLDPNYCYVYRMSFNGGSSSLGGNARSRLNNTKKIARVSIRIDRTKKTFTVMVDGNQIGQWREAGNFVGKSDGLMFVSRSSYRVAVSRIRLSEWDGRLPSAQAQGDTSKDYVRFANEDHMSGRVTAIRDGKLYLKTPFKNDPLGLNLSNVGFVQFAKPSATLGKAHAIFHLANRGKLEGRLIAWRTDVVEADFVGIGKTTLAPQSVLAIHFK